MYQKSGIITPVYKSGEKSDISNYRPICILSTISKIFEKCVKETLLSFLQKYNLFNNRSVWVSPERGTNDARFHHITRISKKNLDDGRPVVAVYFDTYERHLTL